MTCQWVLTHLVGYKIIIMMVCIVSFIPIKNITTSIAMY